MIMHTADLLILNPQQCETVPDTPSLYAPSPINHLCLRSSRADLSVSLLDLKASLETLQVSKLYRISPWHVRASPIFCSISTVHPSGCDVATYLLPESQDLEALEVGQVLPSVVALGLLRDGALSPLAIDLVLSPELLHGAGSGGTGELGDNEVGESSVGEREDVARDNLGLLGGRTVDQDLFCRDSSQYHILQNPSFKCLRRMIPDRKNVHACGRQFRQWWPAFR